MDARNDEDNHPDETNTDQSPAPEQNEDVTKESSDIPTEPAPAGGGKPASTDDDLSASFPEVDSQSADGTGEQETTEKASEKEEEDEGKSGEQDNEQKAEKEQEQAEETEAGSGSESEEKPQEAGEKKMAPYVEAEDGNIHVVHEDHKAAILRLTQPEEEDDIHLGFTKQGKPIKANPYYKYTLRHRDVTEEPKPTPTAEAEAHSSRLTRRPRGETELAMGPSPALEKIKEEFCDWLTSLSSSRDVAISRERLDELFSLGLENNLVVRPPEVRMPQSTRPRRGSPEPLKTARSEDKQKQKESSVAYCRSPSLTYYPELREKWRQRGLKRQLPTWLPGYHAVAPPPRAHVHYGDWYIPISKWTPLKGSRRLSPPETEEARQLRHREQQTIKLNETLSKSHAMSALREYIRLRQHQHDGPDSTPNLVHDVDQLLAAMEQQAKKPKRRAPGPAGRCTPRDPRTPRDPAGPQDRGAPQTLPSFAVHVVEAPHSGHRAIEAGEERPPPS